MSRAIPLNGIWKKWIIFIVCFHLFFVYFVYMKYLSLMDKLLTSPTMRSVFDRFDITTSTKRTKTKEKSNELIFLNKCLHFANVVVFFLFDFVFLNHWKQQNHKFDCLLGFVCFVFCTVSLFSGCFCLSKNFRLSHF